VKREIWKNYIQSTTGSGVDAKGPPMHETTLSIELLGTLLITVDYGDRYKN